MSAEPSSSAVTTDPAGRLKATGIDVRGVSVDSSPGRGLRLQLHTGRRALRRATRWSRTPGATPSRARSRRAADRATIVSVLQAQQAQRNAPPAARAAAARLADPASVAVVTGQQAGVFGGPLFTLLKALTALQLARRTERDLAVPVVTVFWVEAEDHDWEEVESCTVLDAEFQPRTVTLADLEGAGELPIAQLELDARVEQTIDELAAVLQQTEFTAADPRRPPRRLEARDAAWRARSRRGSKRCSGRTASSCSSRRTRPPSRSSRTCSRGSCRRRDAPPRSRPRPARRSRRADTRRRSCRSPTASRSSVSNGGRTPIKKQGDQLVIGDDDALERGARARGDGASRAVQPERAAPPDRPGHALPDHLLRGRPERAGVPRAAARRLRGVRRADAAHVPAHDRDAARFGRDALPREVRACRSSICARRTNPRSNKLLESQLPASVEESLRDAATQTQQSMARVVDALPSLDPTLAGAAKTTLGKMEHELRSLHSKVIHAAKKRDETLRRQFVRAQAQAFPARPSAGTHARRRLLPQQVRSRAWSTCCSRSCHRSRPALADHAVGSGSASADRPEP